MTRIRLGPLDPPPGTVRVPGDKSIGHRALFLNAIAEGTAVVGGVPAGRDLAATLGALRSLGASIAGMPGDRLRIEGSAAAKQRPGPLAAGGPDRDDDGEAGPTVAAASPERCDALGQLRHDPRLRDARDPERLTSVSSERE